MTPQADHAAAIADEMLLDAGLAQDAELRRALLSVGALAGLPVPAPSGQLAALLGGPVHAAPEDAPDQPSDDTWGNPGDELGRRRRLRAHRPTVVGLALLAGMGMGVGTVAASSAGPAPAGSLSIQHMLEDWAPTWAVRPPQATVPGLLRTGNDDGGNDVRAQREGGATSSETPLAEDPASTPPQSRPSGPAPVPQTPEQGRKRSVELSAANGQGGAKEPENNAGAARDNHGANPGPRAHADPWTGAGNAQAAGEEEPRQGVRPAPGPLTEPGQGASGQGGSASTGGKDVPGAKWLGKFVR